MRQCQKQTFTQGLSRSALDLHPNLDKQFKWWPFMVKTAPCQLGQRKLQDERLPHNLFLSEKFMRSVLSLSCLISRNMARNHNTNCAKSATRQKICAIIIASDAMRSSICLHPCWCCICKLISHKAWLIMEICCCLTRLEWWRFNRLSNMVTVGNGRLLRTRRRKI